MIWKPDKRMFLDWPGYLIAVGLVALITLLKYFAQSSFFPPDKAIPYMLAIALTAIFFGLGPSILSSILSILAYDYFFISPEFAFAFTQHHMIAVLVIFLLVGLIISYLASNLRWKTEEARRLSALLLKAREEESRRLARELHDDTAQTLAYLGIELDALSTKFRSLPEEIIRRLKTIQEKINNTQQDIRRFSHELHPAILENLGLEAALETLTTEMNPDGKMEVQLNIDGAERHLPDDISLNLYRIAQEAFNNIFKHASATQVAVNLRYAADKIILSVADNGIGFSVSTRTSSKTRSGLGLVNMKERAALIGAELKIESGAGQGTIISVKAPLPKSGNE